LKPPISAIFRAARITFLAVPSPISAASARSDVVAVAMLSTVP